MVEDCFGCQLKTCEKTSGVQLMITDALAAFSNIYFQRIF